MVFFYFCYIFCTGTCPPWQCPAFYSLQAISLVIHIGMLLHRRGMMHFYCIFYRPIGFFINGINNSSKVRNLQPYILNQKQKKKLVYGAQAFLPQGTQISFFYIGMTRLLYQNKHATLTFLPLA